MIPFSCSNCGTKFRVKAELAGRSGTCPSCQQPLVVPAAVDEVAAPTGELTGQASSLQRAGLDVTVSLQSPADDSFAAASLAQLVPESSRPTSRYVIEKEIARGGMGAVVRAMDCDIRREVAIKFMLDPDDAAKKARFVEEAQITGQLEHPNIVPIHELGLDAEQRLFFAMKMVRGRSLAEILAGLRDASAEYEPDWPLSRLLNILVSICNALGYAHARGVIHRDLKPANIMVGDFGEVYVMDWGLAKVIRPNDAPSTNSDSPRSLPALLAPSGSAPTSSGSHTQQIFTTRELDGELTQDGAIMGTPSYMPPEQARGEIQSLDARTDIYSIGAMLYEMLTLLSPIEREGGNIAILMRVVEGQIQPPAQRAPQRTQQGYIPKELAAIAMKALARRPADRYPSCAELRQDLERFQDGRSVSAKADSAWELLQKLVRRNRAASVAIAVATVVLLTFAAIFLKLNRDARLLAEEHQRTAERERETADEQKRRAESAQVETQRAYAEFQREQQAKERVIRESVPALLRAGRQQANEGHVEAAQQQVTLALAYAPDDPDVHLLQGELWLSSQRFADCRRALQTVLRHRPDDTVAQALLMQLGDSDPPDNVRLFALAELLKEQQLTGLAVPLLATVKAVAEKKKPLVELYQKQIEANWPGQGSRLKLEENGVIHLRFGNTKEVADLSPLRGMKLEHVDLTGNHRIRDLSPLAEMPLQRLSLYLCSSVDNIEPLRGMPLTSLSLYQCSRIHDFSPLKGMPLQYLDLTNCSNFTDCELLRGMPLTDLILPSAITTLEPLAGMPLVNLQLSGCQFVKDLSPLRGMKLRSLYIWRSDVKDLSPLAGMPLEKLVADGIRVNDLEPLRGMPLKDLQIDAPKSGSLEPLQGLPLKRLRLLGAADLSPLKGIELEWVEFIPDAVTQGMEVLREMKSLHTISHWTAARQYPYSPAEFWRRYDAGEFKPK